MVDWDRRQKVAETITAWLTVAAWVVGGGFAAWQYIEHKQDVRIERTLEYVARLNDERLFGSMENLEQRYDDSYASLIKILKPDPPLPQDIVNRRYYEFILDHINQHKLQEEIRSLTIFLEEIVVCVQSSLCDDDIARKYFGFGQNFFQRYYPFFCEQRKKMV